MDAVVALERCGGYATRRALLAAGASKREISAAVADRRIIRLRRGVYGAGLAEGEARLRAAAVGLRGVVSHDSAAVLWGLEIAHQPGRHVTVARNRSRASLPGVDVHRADLAETAVRNGLRVTTVVRTVLDCARTLPLADAVVVADSALRAGLVTGHELASAAASLTGRDAARVRRVVGLADAECGSVLESLLRVLLVEHGLLPDATQFVVRDEHGHFVARVDFAWPGARLIVEADGFEFHRGRDDYRRDRRKANAFCGLGWRLLRFTWEDVRFDPSYVVAAVRRELAKPVPSNTQTAA